MKTIRNEASRKMKKPWGHHFAPLLKTLQWLPISLRIKTKVPTMDYSKDQHHLPLNLYSLTSLTSFATLFLFAHSSLATLASLVLPEHGKLVPTIGLLPFPVSGLIFPYIIARFSHLLSSGPFKVYLSRKSSSATVPGSKRQEDQSSFAILWISSSGYWFLCFNFVAVQLLSQSDSLQPHNCSTHGFPVLYYLLEIAQIHVHWVTDAI